MKIEHIFFASVLFCFSFTSCSDNAPQDIIDDNFFDAHTSQNSLDWNGTYVGTIKGLEGENFLVSLSLEVDGFYSIELKDERHHIVKRNKFTWAPDGQMIELYDVNEILNKFFVAENRLIQLDAQGNRPQDETNYELKKLDHEI